MVHSIPLRILVRIQHVSSKLRRSEYISWINGIKFILEGLILAKSINKKSNTSFDVLWDYNFVKKVTLNGRTPKTNFYGKNVQIKVTY